MTASNYVKFSYYLDNPYCIFSELEILPINDDDMFSEIEFTDGFVTLYCKEEYISQVNSSTEDVKKEVAKNAEHRLFAIFLEIINSSSALNFVTRIEEICIHNKKTVVSIMNCSIQVSDEVKKITLKKNGVIYTEEENRQSVLQNNNNKMAQIILYSHSMMAIQDQDKQRLTKLFMVKETVIRYFIIYSWLSELLQENGRDSQEKVDNFILNSKTYVAIPDFFKSPPMRNGRIDKTYFTYLRNLMGHTVTDTLAVSDETIIEKVRLCTSWLTQILLEKLV